MRTELRQNILFADGEMTLLIQQFEYLNRG